MSPTAPFLRAEREYHQLLERLGARLAPGASYTGSKHRTPLICAAGHDCEPRPSDLRSGHGPCRTCAGKDRAAAEDTFWRHVHACGARAAPGARYVNAGTPVPLLCAGGHPCAPRPTNLKAGQGPCRVCAGTDTDSARERFHANLARHGAQLAPGAGYVDAKTPVQLVCAAGHRCAPTPRALTQGQGVCELCSVAFDRVYLMAHPGCGALKVGVASGPARVRLHGARGYELIAHWTGLEHHVARAAESDVLAWWRAQGWSAHPSAPMDGRTETTALAHAERTRRRLRARLGTPRPPG